jgi:hypothetical protein
VEEVPEGMTKKQAVGTSTWSIDFCAEYGWYGDAVCDTFCPLPDPDCEEDPAPTDHRPYCGAIGSRSEGWYWGDTRELIAYAACADLGEPECRAIGSRSEGWYTSDGGRITWDFCHETVRIAVEGEACGPSIGFSCHHNLYCQGVPDGVIGGTGVCRWNGTCGTVSDCHAEGNAWIHPMCTGYATCNEGRCGWTCGAVPPPQPEGPWVWTTVLLANVQSEHPYANDFTDTWEVHRPGASEIKVRFNRIDIEAGYDSLTVAGTQEESALLLDGQQTDLWTPVFNGDTLILTLTSDYSVTGWGFKADTVSYHEQLEAGMCTRDDHCTDIGEQCREHLCINPYAPCYGDCWRDDRCDDGTTPMCEILPGPCPAGQILAFQSRCFQCVDPQTCEPAAPAPTSGEFFSNEVPIGIPDDDVYGVKSTIDVTGMADCAANARVRLDIRHTYRGDLHVELVDPSDATTVLWNQEGGGADDLALDDLITVPTANGPWTVVVSDRYAWDTGTLETFSIEVTCN